MKIEGAVAKPQTLDMDAILKIAPLEERIYRHRCVERWSMVIPWIGFPLNALLKQVQPTEKAKYVAFESFYDSKNMLNSFQAGIRFPYIEGLRMDEAMHPLALLAVGLYGETLPNQDGAPFRLVVPWKYGFKSIKSIVKIQLVEKEPPTTWNISGPSEYGFYSNVNPERDHPRWSQTKERRIGEFRLRDTAEVQRLRRSGGWPVHRDGSSQVLLRGMNKVLSSRWTKVVLVPAVPGSVASARSGAGYRNKLGANPIEYITHKTGDWTLRFLLITLSVTPLRKILNQPKLARFRRMLGLFAFFYGCLHLTTWVWLDKFFDLSRNVEGCGEAPFYYRGDDGVCFDDSAGHHFHRRMGAAAGIRALAAAAPAGLFQRAGGSDSLLLAGEIRRAAAAAVWRNSGGVAGLSIAHGCRQNLLGHAATRPEWARISRLCRC